jgi:hypothetical protein
MRKSVLFILLATAAMPALAAVQSEDRRGDRRAARAERSESGESQNAQRTERTARAERGESGDGQKAQQTQRAARTDRAEAVQGVTSVQPVERGERVRAPRAERSQAIVQSSGQASNNDAGRRNRTSPVVTRESSDSVTDWRARERRVSGTTSPTIPTTTQSTTNTRSTNWGNHNRDHDGHRWSGEWRKDHRYNWRTYRSRYASLFRLGRYYDPFGYGYRRWSIGYSLWPSYYGSNYWLNEPWQYRLPPAYGPYRWIRYYNDALLVNIYSGEVVDVIYGFFW